jgi:hypothetical protein
MRGWVTAAGNEAERAQKMTRERGGKTREGVRNSPPSSPLSLSLSLFSLACPRFPLPDCLPLTVTDGDGAAAVHCRVTTTAP